MLQERKVELPEPDEAITIRQRGTIPFREIAMTTIRRYPRRAILGLALFIGQAFLYNAVVFDLGTILSEFFGVGSATVPFYIFVFALSNFFGPLLLGRLFDTVGRIPMISGTYLGSAALVTLLGVLMLSGSLTTFSFMLLVLATFFLASAGASSAYLTVSEVFPLETRALSISLFFAVGTAAGGIAGPALFGQFVHSGDADLVALGFFIGAAAMALGGVAELLFGVRAEQRSLEAIARPLTAAEADAADRGEPLAAPALAEADADGRIRARAERERARDRRGLRRLRPGPGSGSRYFSPGMVGSVGAASRTDAMADRDRDREIEAIYAILDRRGELDDRELSRSLGGVGWGPGRFDGAVRAALEEGRIVRVAGGAYRITRAGPPRDGRPGAARERPAKANSADPPRSA